MHKHSCSKVERTTEVRTPTRDEASGDETQGAEVLIETIESEAVRAGDDVVALSLRGELALQRSEWELAASHFSRLWSAAVSGRQGFDIDAVARRLAELERRLGPERFGVVYAQPAGSTPTPASLGVMVAESLGGARG